MAQEKKNIENFFKKALEGYEGDIHFKDEHWEQMATMLDEQMPVISSPTNTYYYTTNLISIATGVVLLLGTLWNFNLQKQNSLLASREIPESVPNQSGSAAPITLESSDSQIPQQEPGQQVAAVVSNRDDSSSQVTVASDTEDTQNLAKVSERSTAPEISRPAAATNPEAANSERATTRLVESIERTPRGTVSEDANVLIPENTGLADQALLALEKDEKDGKPPRYSTLAALKKRPGQISLVPPLGLPSSIQEVQPISRNEQIDEIIRSRASSVFPRLGVSLVISPDLSSNRMLKYNRFGSEMGVVLEYRLNPKLSVEGGAMITRKRYVAAASAYKSPDGFWRDATGGELPTEVSASCQVLDVPLNLRYRIFENDVSSFSGSIGVSSYFMLQEDYEFDMSWGPWYWGTKGENNHFFGVGNLQVHYERKLGKRFAIEAAPFLKLPLTGYGHGSIKFHSLGAFFGVKRYFLFKPRKQR